MRLSLTKLKMSLIRSESRMVLGRWGTGTSGFRKSLDGPRAMSGQVALGFAEIPHSEPFIQRIQIVDSRRTYLSVLVREWLKGQGLAW